MGSTHTLKLRVHLKMAARFFRILRIFILPAVVPNK